MTGSGWIGLVSALAITLGLLALSLRLLRRFQAGPAWRSKGIPLRVLQRAALGPKLGVAVVQVADRVLVVSIAENGARLLTELTGEALATALGPGPGEAQRPGLGLRVPFLGRLTLALGLLVVPAVLGFGPADLWAQTRASTAAASASATPIAIPGPIVTPPVPPKVSITLGEGPGALHLSGAVGLVVFLGVLTLLPAMFLLMTSFTRILIVLHFLRSALGAQTTPPGQLLVAVAVLLTGVVMNPVLKETNRIALQPYFAGQITQVDAYTRAAKPFREFMLANTREQDLTLFTELSKATEARSVEEIPLVTVVSAFVTSELRTAFQMGFVIFLPFLVVDVIVASVLMSMGMFMLPPVMISLPFKLLLFVLADGWTLVVQNLVASFR